MNRNEVFFGLITFARMIVQGLVDLFFPATCAGCNLPLSEGEEVLCISCMHNLPLTNHFNYKENEVYRRFYGRLPVEWASAMCYYHKQGIVQEMIHKLKYRGMEKIGSFMGEWIALEMKQNPAFADLTHIIPVPLHPKKLKQRGYNQVTELAKTIANSLSVAFVPEFLVRNRYSETQTHKNLLARTALGGELFSRTVEPSEKCHFLLVDDVITTGSTLEACGRALLTGSNARLSIACIGMAHT